MRLQRCHRYGDGLGGVELWERLSSKGCACKGGKTAWKELSSGCGAGLLHAEPEMRSDLCSPGWKQMHSALGLSPSMSGHVVSYHGSADMRPLARLFEGPSPKILEKEINKRKQNKRMEEESTVAAAGSERLILEWTGTTRAHLATGCSLHHRAEI